uniref:Uncharacterized protein n=1 Tax=Arundo donax TaxID=35708 RepID=A0A0A8ZY85_ARUDO
MKVKGCNKFKIPHMQKEKLEREDRLPLQISCEASLLAECIASLPYCSFCASCFIFASSNFLITCSGRSIVSPSI